MEQARPLKHTDIDTKGPMYHCLSAIQTSFWKLYQSGRFADFTVTCRGRTFRLHRAIPSGGDDMLPMRLALTITEPDPKRGTVNTPNVDEVNIDEDPKLMELLFQFLYLGNYSDGEYSGEIPSIQGVMDAKEIQEETLLNVPDTIHTMDFEAGREEDELTVESESWGSAHDSNPFEESGDEEEYDSDNSEEEKPITKDEMCDAVYYPSALRTSVQLYVLADKYKIPVLCQLAQERFMRSAENPRMKIDDFYNIIDTVCTYTPAGDPLRQFVCNIISPQYYSDSDIRSSMQRTMEKHPDFAALMMNSICTLAKNDELTKRLRDLAEEEEEE
ncbi:hypothetical protein P170DRAFT_431216 [Aspergillus steynii IBT 23096]|uniref:BTB domain-containing protein n=1 Tax=Aspergillus steynii IBT 23096 TaxID=1392250 RepID=A0A2I2FRM5_9EURO|nr:uncharacterized protein P170DRAFT_431216 [Aspergillus steynii IBT 23096]PLB43256.1 hypothetical protein P170DRAFT_431216 [Aspergillus steynii IBT 23096]